MPPIAGQMPKGSYIYTKMTSMPSNKMQSGDDFSTIATPQSSSAVNNDIEKSVVLAEEMSRDRDADGKIDQSLDDEKDIPKESPQSKTKSEKVKVHPVAVRSLPILKKSKFLMNANNCFTVAIAFLRKVLKLSSGTNAVTASSLFLYVNAALVPSLEGQIEDLFDCFGTKGELVVYYSLQEAWG